MCLMFHTAHSLNSTALIFFIFFKKTRICFDHFLVAKLWWPSLVWTLWEYARNGFVSFWVILFFFSFDSIKMDPGVNGEEPTSWEDLYNINLMPSELFLKFRKEIQGIRVGLNLEVSFYALARFNFYLSNSIAFNFWYVTSVFGSQNMKGKVVLWTM